MRLSAFVKSSREVVGRVIIAGALVGAVAIVGVEGTAQAVIPNHLAITVAPSSTDASGAALATQPQITLEDNTNATVTGMADLITATITAGGVSVSNATATIVSGTGIATFSGLALNALAGGYTLTFTDTTNGGVTSAQSTTITVSVGVASQLVITTQPSANAISGVALVTQPVVKAEDSGGNVDATVSGTATASSTGIPTISSGSTSFSSGVATFVGLNLTGLSGATTTLLFTGDTLPAVVSNTITLSTAATKLVITTPSSTTALSGAALTVQPVVTVEDASNHTVVANDGTVTATITVGGVSVTNPTATSPNGVATFAGLALNASAGTYTLTFSDGALTTAVSATITVSVGAAAKLKILTEPSTAVQSGAALSQQPVVQVQDSGGNPITTTTSTITATLTAGSGTITNPTATSLLGSGVATFSGLAISATAGLYTLTFSDGALTTTVSTGITVSTGAAAKLVIITQPSITVASGVALAVQPVIKVEDSGGNVVSGNTSTVTATVTVGTNTAVNNTAVVSSSTGLATFSGLALNALVGNYTLTFSDGGLTTAVSSSISVTPGVASKLVVTTQPSTTDASGAALVVQPVVKVEDAAGNTVVTDTTTVTAKITTGGVSVTSPTAVAVAGVASFGGVALNALAGPYTLTFTDGTLTAAVSTTITVSTGVATHIVVATEPSVRPASGVALAAQPVVKVEDSGGNVVTTLSSGSVTAAVFTGAGGAVSAGASAPISSGVANFSGLAITGVAGNTYTLVFTGDSFSVNDATPIVLASLQATLAVTSLNGVLGRTLTLTATGGSGSGTVTFTVAAGTASGCAVSGTTLRYTSTGTCLVTATKAGDTTYLSISSAATPVTVAKLPKPGAVRVNFAHNSSTLSGAAKTALTSLSKKLTTRSSVTIVGYAKGNPALAKRRASAASQFLRGKVKVKVHLQWNVTSSLQASRLITTGQ